MVLEKFITDTLQAAIKAGTPLLLATLGEIYAERSGVLNLGVEGMMLMGAVSGFLVTYTTGNPWLGIVVAMLMGMLFSLIHAFMTITLKANQVVSGIALTMLGIGLSSMTGKNYIGKVLSNPLRSTPIPFLSDLPVLGESLFSQDPLVYLSIMITILLWVILYRTKFGLMIRAVGENPAVADSAGVNVYRVRYLCVALGGALAGLAGAHLSLAYTYAWIENMTAGKGWIAIGLTIFSAWDPLRALFGAYLFGGIDILKFRVQQYGMNPHLLGTLPYLSTILIVILGTSERLRKRLGAPASLGLPYEREEKTL
ncbi:MAG: ABC transporter permease [Candidatus Asgardarchaeia archaeon]